MGLPSVLKLRWRISSSSSANTTKHPTRLAALGPDFGEAALGDKNEQLPKDLETLTIEELRQLLAEVEKRLREKLGHLRSACT
jgi:hypothetical protein